MLEKKTISYIIAFIGGISLLEWLTNTRIISGLYMASLPTPPDVALIFVTLAFILQHSENNRRSEASLVREAILTGVAFYGLFKFTEYFLHASYYQTFNAKWALWKISPVSAILFFIAAITIIYSNRNSQKPLKRKIIFSSGLLIGFTGFTAVLGYLYNTPLLYGNNIIPIALTTAIAFLLLGYRIVLITGNIFFPEDASKGIAAMRILKTTLPAVILSILLQGFLMGNATGYVQTHKALYTSLICLSIIIFISFYVIRVTQMVFKNAIEAEMKLRKEHEFNQLLLDNLIEGVVACDTEGKLTVLNKALKSAMWATEIQTFEDIVHAYNLYHSDGITPMKREDLPLYRAAHGEIIKNEEACIIGENNKHKYFRINGAPFFDNNNRKLGALITLHDITEAKALELERAVTINMLEILNEKNDLQGLIKNIIVFLQRWIKSDAVGIRLKNNEDFPYYETKGFSSDFVNKERYLCKRNRDNCIGRDKRGKPEYECMCGEIICGTMDTKKPFITSHGSFVTNSATTLIATTPSSELQRNPRISCTNEGYESIAIIPLRSGSENIGTIQLNDKKENCFSESMISIIEKLSNNIALALHQRLTEEDLKESEEKYRSLAESNNDYIMRYDKGGRHLYMNPSALKVTGITAEQIIGKTHLEAGFDPEQSRFWEEKINHVFETREPYSSQFKWESIDGPVHLDWRLTPEFGKNGEVKSVLGVSRDITLLKKHEEKLRILSSATEQNASSIVITNSKGNIEYVNPKFTELTGYEPEDIMGENPRLLKSGQTPEEIYSELWNALLKGETWHGEFINRKKNGEIYYESASVAPIHDENNTVTHFVAIKEDITEKKNLIKELIASKEKAEESDRLKTAFLTNMSHEIRTPMNAIMGFSELLTSKQLDEETIHKYAHIINSRSVYLLSLIDDILDLSKAEAGITQLRETCFQLNELLDEINAQITLKLVKFRKKVTFVLEKEKEDGNSIICTDKTRLQQILINLIDNAIKFTIEGKITLTYTTDKNKGVIFCVSDTGIGIPHEHIDKVFERFHKSNNLSLNYSGLGLGLSICNGIVKIMGGKIWLNSEEGKGTSFYFNIPVKYPSNHQPKHNNVATEYKDTGGGKILMVEDDEFNISFMKEVLGEFELIIAETGEQALNLYNAHKNIDLILMDIRLPDMDGLEITRTIRRTGSQIPIIALTANAFETDRQSCFEAGCTGFASKPLETKLLVQKIKGHMKDYKLSIVKN